MIRTAMPPTPRNPAKALFHSLKGLGLTQASINAVLPAWWDDSLADDPAGMAELKVLLARRLSIDPATVFDPTKRLDFVPVVRRYKGGRPDLLDKLRASTAIAGSLGRTALAVVGARQSGLPRDPHALRQQLLDRGARWIGIEQLLDLCWHCGIPVLHASFPTNLSKFDAVAMTEHGHYAIVLCRNEGSIGWLTFHLAHELGHVACSHIGADAMLVDEAIDDKQASLTRQQEVEANDFALKVLGGQGVELPPIDRRTPASRIASLALQIGQAHHVLPAHLVLKAAMRDNHFPLARQALGYLEGQHDARALINERAARELAAAGWTGEAEEFIQQFTWAPKV